METNNHQIVDYDLVLDEKFGKIGTPERTKSEEKSRAYYASQILSESRRESGMTQNELARRVGMTRAQIAKIENGTVEPGVGLFYRIVGELGLRVDIVRPL